MSYKRDLCPWYAWNIKKMHLHKPILFDKSIENYREI